MLFEKTKLLRSAMFHPLKVFPDHSGLAMLTGMMPADRLGTQERVTVSRHRKREMVRKNGTQSGTLKPGLIGAMEDEK
jgi:hypothetical protein